MSWENTIEWYSRTKLTAKIDLNKKYSPYLATEVFYLIDNAKEKDEGIDRFPLWSRVDYEFNLHHNINVLPDSAQSGESC